MSERYMVVSLGCMQKEEGKGVLECSEGPWVLGTDPVSELSLPPCSQSPLQISVRSDGWLGTPSSTCWSASLSHSHLW